MGEMAEMGEMGAVWATAGRIAPVTTNIAASAHATRGIHHPP
jgi:hypothetical protein